MQTTNYHDLLQKLPKFLSLTLIFWCLLSLSACGRGESNVESGNRDGILHVGNGTEPQTLDPHIATGIPEHHIISALFEGLVSKDPASLEVRPGVARSWDISDDGKIYTFKLREEAKWSNGDQITAHDFVWSWWRALQPKLGNQYVFMFFQIKNAEAFFKGEVSSFEKVGVKALGDFTLQVELSNPTPYFLQLLDHYSTYPIHQPTIEEWGKPDESYTRWTRPENLIGNGPFNIDKWRLNKLLTVTKSDTYWGKEDVKLNGIHYHPVESPVVEERLFRAGQLHFTNDTAIDRMSYYLENNPQSLRIAPYAGTYFYRFNTKKQQLADPRVRNALSLSIDRDALIKAALNNIVTPAYAMTPPGVLGYQPPKIFKYDPEKARSLLAQAGFPNGEGFPTFELQFNTSESHRKIAIIIQEMWKKELGINVELQNKDWKVYLDSEATGDYDISRAGWIGDYVDPNTFLDLWSSDSLLNRTGWGNAEFDQLVLRDAPKAKTREERFAIFKKAETILISEMPIIPLYTYSNDTYIHPSVDGMPTNIINYLNFRDISLNPDWNNDKASSEVK